MKVLSIQSHVAYGHVGNASAVFPMQRLGVEVWPVHTVQFSNHTGYGAWRGRVFDGPAVEEVIQGVAERGALKHCDAVLSGYMGSADIGTAILRAVAAVRAANREAIYCCDPVIGDTYSGSMFARASPISCGAKRYRRPTSSHPTSSSSISSPGDRPIRWPPPRRL